MFEYVNEPGPSVREHDRRPVSAVLPRVIPPPLSRVPSHDQENDVECGPDSAAACRDSLLQNKLKECVTGGQCGNVTNVTHASHHSDQVTTTPRQNEPISGSTKGQMHIY